MKASLDAFVFTRNEALTIQAYRLIKVHAKVTYRFVTFDSLSEATIFNLKYRGHRLVRFTPNESVDYSYLWWLEYNKNDDLSERRELTDDIQARGYNETLFGYQCTFKSPASRTEFQRKCDPYPPDAYLRAIRKASFYDLNAMIYVYGSLLPEKA